VFDSNRHSSKFVLRIYQFPITRQRIGVNFSKQSRFDTTVNGLNKKSAIEKDNGGFQYVVYRYFYSFAGAPDLLTGASPFGAAFTLPLIRIVLVGVLTAFD